ncbi:MAG: efflux RND transporter periplasmic adaptor subunit [Burkholderiaceae bacterium]
MKATRLLIAGSVLVALAFGAWQAWAKFNTPKVSPVRSVELHRTRLQSTLSAVGHLSSRDEISLSAPVSSTVRTLHVALGDHIRAGQRIIDFDPKDFANRLNAAQASQREALSELRNAQRNLQSLRPVVAAGGAPVQTQRDAQAMVAQARARLDRFSAQTSGLQTEQTNYHLDAPVDGVVISLDVRQGQYLTTGKPVLSLVPTDNLMIRARIDQSVSPSLKPGTAIDVASENQAGITLKLNIDSIDPAVEREGSSSYVIAWIRYPSDAKLKLRLNQQVDLNVVTELREQALALPLEGLVTKGDDEFVRVIHDNRIVMLPVTTGIQDADLIEITSGLSGEEQIVVPMSRNVREGDRVQLTKGKKGNNGNERENGKAAQ